MKKSYFERIHAKILYCLNWSSNVSAHKFWCVTNCPFNVLFPCRITIWLKRLLKSFKDDWARLQQRHLYYKVLWRHTIDYWATAPPLGNKADVMQSIESMELIWLIVFKKFITPPKTIQFLTLNTLLKAENML